MTLCTCFETSFHEGFLRIVEGVGVEQMCGDGHVRDSRHSALNIELALCLRSCYLNTLTWSGTFTTTRVCPS